MKNAARDQEIIRRIQNGERPDDIASSVGLTDARIRQIRHRYGIRLQGLDIKTRFMMNVEKTDTCWIWTKYIDPAGYGRIRINGKAERSHRLAYRLFVDPSATGPVHILHSCDNPRCVNPDHLRLGTPADNAFDRETRGRGKTRKLTTDQVQFVRASEKTSLQLARELGVHRSTIERIRRGSKWKWLAAG